VIGRGVLTAPGEAIYVPLAWVARLYRIVAKTTRAELHGALFASKYLAKVRGRHHQAIQRDLSSLPQRTARWGIAGELLSSLFVVSIALAFLLVQVAVVADLAGSTPAEFVGAAALLVLGWGTVTIVLTPLVFLGGCLVSCAGNSSLKFRVGG
jgi:hypothetical protein